MSDSRDYVSEDPAVLAVGDIGRSILEGSGDILDQRIDNEWPEAHGLSRVQ